MLTWLKCHPCCGASLLLMIRLVFVRPCQSTSLPIVYYSAVCSGADKKTHQNSASLAFVRGIHQWPVNSPHKGPATRKMFPFDDVIMHSVIAIQHTSRKNGITYTVIRHASMVLVTSIYIELNICATQNETARAKFAAENMLLPALYMIQITT